MKYNFSKLCAVYEIIMKIQRRQKGHNILYKETYNCREIKRVVLSQIMLLEYLRMRNFLGT